MGVHDVDKYSEIKALLGIPEDEPIFILRGQDKLASDTIFFYKKAAEIAEAPTASRPLNEKGDTIGECVHDFDMFAKRNPERMKAPD